MSTVTVAPHLQRALEAMARDLAIEPQALVNQALFAWLRINGYTAPGAAQQVTTHPEAPAAPPVIAPVAAPPPAVSSAPVTGLAPSLQRPAEPPSTPTPAPVAPTPAPVAAPAPVSSSSSGVTSDPRAVAVARLAEIDADLEKLARPWPDFVAPEAEEEEDAEREDEDEDERAEAPSQESAAPAPDAAEDEPPPDDEADAPRDEGESDDDAPPPDEDEPVGDDEAPAPAAAAGPVPDAEDDGFRPTAIRESDEGLVVGDERQEEPPPDEDEPPPESTVVLRSVPIVLYLERDGEEPIRIESERFIIGRGPQCDLIIDSPRVSREHVVLTREGVRYFIEDLNSSNGTWLGEERLTKREIESGDLIHLGNEPVTFILRGE